MYRNRFNNMSPQLLAQALQRLNNPDGVFMPQSPAMQVQPNQNVMPPANNQIGISQQNQMNAYGRTYTPSQEKTPFGLSPQISNAKMGY